jgi:DNA-binding transcriptional MerR regulator
MTETTYTIKNLEHLSGIKAHTIRIWEKRYGLLSPERTETNIRRYSSEDLKKLLNISILVNGDIKISRIASLTMDDLRKKALDTTGYFASYNSIQIEKIILYIIEMDTFNVERTISKLVNKIGFEETIYDIIFPLLNRIGILWQTNSIIPAQEHFIFNLMRQKMIYETEKLKQPQAGAPSELFFLPEGEYHEFSLMFYNYLARKNGHFTVYLGQSVPISDIIEISKNFNFDYYFTATIVPQPSSALSDYMNSINLKTIKAKLFITGSQARKYCKKQSDNVRLISRPAKFIKEISTLKSTSFNNLYL